MLMASCRASVLISGFEPCDEESEEGDVSGLCCQDPPSPAAEALRANEAVRANRLRTAIVAVIMEESAGDGERSREESEGDWKGQDGRRETRR